MKVRVRRWIAFAGCLILEDTKGRLWERSAKYPLGVWGRVELPDEPQLRERRRVGRKSPSHG